MRALLQQEVDSLPGDKASKDGDDPARSRAAHAPSAIAASASPMDAAATSASKPPFAAHPTRAALWLQANALSMVLWVISIGGLLLFWYLGTKYRWDFYMRFTNVPTPGEVLSKVAEVSQSTRFLTHIGISVRRILFGFLIAAAIGIPLGLMVGRYRVARDLVMPIIEVLRPIPAIAWVPMAIMLWPTNEVSIVFITFLGSFFPILLNTVHGVRSLDGVLIRAARCLGAHELRLFTNVMLPGVLPHIFTGLSVGMGVAWVSLIAAEMISGQFGVGYFTWEAYSLVSYPEIGLGMITIGLLGLGCSGAIQLIGLAVMPWLSHSNAGKR
jgi:NitT/TauT family transport system permease protein